MDIYYIKETPYNENNTEAQYLRVLLLNTAIVGIFEAISYIYKPGAIYGRKSNFILTFLREGCLVYQIYQVQYLQSHKPGFWGYKIVK